MTKRSDALADRRSGGVTTLRRIHYRFDCVAGLRIGRQVADLALASDVRGHEAFVLR
jgi:hypothetical protein